MRILLLTDEYRRHDSIGGGDVMAQSVSTGLVSRGHSVGICCNWGESADRIPYIYPAEFRVLCPKRIWKRSGTIGFYRHLLADRWHIRSVLNQFHPDVIYCLHQRGIAVPTISFVNGLKAVPVVYRMGDEWLRLHYYNDKYDIGRLWARKDANSRFLRLAITSFARLIGDDAGLFSRSCFLARSIVFNSADLARRSAPFISGEFAARIIRNGIDLQAFRFRLRKIPSTRAVRLLYVGRLVVHKGVHLLPTITKLLRGTKRLAHSTLTIVGSSDDREYMVSLRNEFRKLGLSSVVKFMGAVPRSEMSRLYDVHDLLLFTTPPRSSRYTVEGCPSVLIEAMACGLPIVARMSPGVDEVVADGETCIAVHEHGVEPMASAVLNLWSDKQLYHRLSKAGRGHVERHYSLSGMLDQTEAVLLEAQNHGI